MSTPRLPPQLHGGTVSSLQLTPQDGQLAQGDDDLTPPGRRSIQHEEADEDGLGSSRGSLNGQGEEEDDDQDRDPEVDDPEEVNKRTKVAKWFASILTFLARLGTIYVLLTGWAIFGQSQQG
ncbi:hypothetical protein IAT38_002312 [Cryptococcus sp. DSM 104549]